MKTILVLWAIIGYQCCAAQNLPKDRHIFVLPASEFWHKQRWADSVYLFPRFLEGKIELATGVTPTNRPLLNYNVFLETMFIKEGEDKFVPLNETGYKTIWIDDHKFIHSKQFGFMEVILEGKVSIAERTYMDASYSVEGGRYPAGRADLRTRPSKNPRYYWFEQRYFIFADPAHIHRPSTPALSNLVRNHKKSSIKGFVKTHKTRFWNRKDLLEVVSYCNTEL